MTDDELKQLIASNARAIQAAAEERSELRHSMIRLEQAIDQLTNLNAGVVRLLAALDEDRPTILRKLTTIENKVDQLLERETDTHS
jgi:chromosome segregation ATPase